MDNYLGQVRYKNMLKILNTSKIQEQIEEFAHNETVSVIMMNFTKFLLRNFSIKIFVQKILKVLGDGSKIAA